MPEKKENQSVKGLEITRKSLLKSGFKETSKEVKAIDKLIDQHK
jgi:hypothetical protein